MPHTPGDKFNFVVSMYYENLGVFCILRSRGVDVQGAKALPYCFMLFMGQFLISKEEYQVFGKRIPECIESAVGLAFGVCSSGPS